jgi:hypothetical protein
MFADWNIYYKPLHLNNTTGTGSAGGDISSAIDTPFVMLSEADGNSYAPKATNYMDVYSGGSPFTFTQELVQRGAEVQEDTMRIAIIGTTNENCVEQLQLLRNALTNQHLFGPQILSIKRAGQTEYTEWLIHGAIIQEENTYLGRDIKNAGYPTLFVTITLTRSPYASDDFSLYTSELTYTQNGVFASDTNYDVLTNKELYGAYVNFYLNIDYTNMLERPPLTFGPTVLATVIEDSKIIDTTSVSGTLTGGQQAVTVASYTYPIKDTTNSSYPIQMFVIADVQSNEVEMRLLVNGYTTPYVRAVGTQLNSTNGTRRLFVLPSISVNTIFAGAKDYSVYYKVKLDVQLKNINRSSSRTYTLQRVTMCRTDNLVQVFPTTDWSAKSISLANVNIYSFYDQLKYPSQSLPSIKAHLTRYSFYVGPLETNYFLNNYFEETLDIRGVNMRMKNQYGSLQYIIYIMEYNGTTPIGNTSMKNIVIKYAPAYLSIKE